MFQIAELQLFVGYPTRPACPPHLHPLDLPLGDASLNAWVPVWASYLQCLLDEQKQGGRYLGNAISKIVEAPVQRIVGEVRFGGWRGDACSVLVISLFHTRTFKGTLLAPMNESIALEIADWLRDATAARWVVARQAYKRICVTSGQLAEVMR